MELYFTKKLLENRSLRLYYSILLISASLLFLNFFLVSLLSYKASRITKTLQSCKATVLNESNFADFIFLSYCLQVFQLLELKANGFYFTPIRKKCEKLYTNKDNFENVIVEFVNSKQHHVTQKKMVYWLQIYGFPSLHEL